MVHESESCPTHRGSAPVVTDGHLWQGSALVILLWTSSGHLLWVPRLTNPEVQFMFLFLKALFSP